MQTHCCVASKLAWPLHAMQTEIHLDEVYLASTIWLQDLTGTESWLLQEELTCQQWGRHNNVRASPHKCVKHSHICDKFLTNNNHKCHNFGNLPNAEKLPFSDGRKTSPTAGDVFASHHYVLAFLEPLKPRVISFTANTTGQSHIPL